MWRTLLLLLALRAGASELIWSTYFGGSATGSSPGILAVTVDRGGHAYVTGRTDQPVFAVTPGALQPRLNGIDDAFVSKLLPDGSGVAWSTYLGGSSSEEGTGIELDEAGNVYVFGKTFSNDFPHTISERPECPCWFAVKFDGVTGALIYTRTMRSATSETRYSFAIDPGGAVFVAGTESGDATIDKFDQRGNFVWRRTLGGSGRDSGDAVAVAPGGEIVVAGNTESSDFPTTAGASNRTLHTHAAFVTRLGADGSTVISSTYVYGRGYDRVIAARVDAAGNAYLLGSTFITPSSRWPLPWLAKVTPAAAVAWVRPAGADSAGLAVSPAGDVYVSAVAGAATADAIQSVQYQNEEIGRSSTNAALARLRTADGEVSYQTYLGGTGGADSAAAVALDSAGNAYLAGTTNSTDFPTTPGAFARGRYKGGFVAKIGFDTTPTVRILAVVNAASLIGRPVVPGEVITVFGDGLGPGTGVSAQAAGGFLPATLADTQVLADGAPVPLLYVSRTQVNAIVPFGAADLVEVSVVSASGRSRAIPFATTQRDAAAFTRDASGAGLAAALNQDNTPNSQSNPARRGDVVQLWITGAGVTDPPQADGSIAPVGTMTGLREPLQVWVGAAPADVLYAGAAPGMAAGVVQVNIRVPRAIASGSQPLRLLGADTAWIVVE